MEMRYFWLLDQYCQNYLDIYHQTGQENIGDYPKKTTLEHLLRTFAHITYTSQHHRHSFREKLCLVLGEGVLKYLVIPIVDRSQYRGFPITKHKTQHGTQLSHKYKP